MEALRKAGPWGPGQGPAVTILRVGPRFGGEYEHGLSSRLEIRRKARRTLVLQGGRSIDRGIRDFGRSMAGGCSTLAFLIYHVGPGVDGNRSRHPRAMP